jgi:plastocyanin
MRRRTYVGAVVGSVTGLAGCLGNLGTGSAGRGNEDEADVGMTTNAFEPEVYEVAVGEPVVWKNTSSRAHTVTAYGSGRPEGATFFASGGYDTEDAAREAWRQELGGGMDPGDTFEHAFEVPGEHPYFCIPHERQGMVGTVRVLEE